MRNTLQRIQAKMHTVIMTAYISVTFRGMKEDIGISKRSMSHFRISYRSRDISLDCGSSINIGDRIVKKLFLLIQ